MTRLVMDFDYLIYAAGFACETRMVEATHTRSGKKKLFKNQTEFWGRKKTVIEGWLGEQNAEQLAKGRKPFTKEDFTLETIRTADDLPNCLHTVKMMINGALLETGAEEYMGFIGKGDSFRLDRSTIYKYKGNREDALRPLLKDEITKYLIKHHNGVVVEGLEADDWVIIEALKHGDAIVCAVDKDAAGSPVKVWNPNHPEKGVIDCNCFGELEVIEKVSSKGIVTKDIKGYGRKFFYFQVAYGDDVDNYRANCASEKDWGVVSAYNALCDAKNDLEALQALKKVYQTLYPTPTLVTGWRGDTLEIDWLYVFNEVWDLARMMRSEDDFVKGEDVLRKFNLLD